MYHILEANIIAVICIQAFLIKIHYDSYKSGTEVSILYAVFAGITCGQLLISHN